MIFFQFEFLQANLRVERAALFYYAKHQKLFLL